jgi:hypothetical protein
VTLTPVSPMESSKDYEHVARRWYELVNALAPDYIEGVDEPPLPWEDFPEANRRLLVMVVANLIAEGTIR